MLEYNKILQKLPGLNCALCGYKTCEAFAKAVIKDPDIMKRCIHISDDKVNSNLKPNVNNHACAGCGNTCSTSPVPENITWKDSLGREFDFILDNLPNDPGPREVIKLHNPALTKELSIKVGDIIIGRPLGMSCGCPVTHCGIVMDIHELTGVMTWCVTGPLGPRQKGYKDVGYYSAEAYEGIVKYSNKEIKIGIRYWFMPYKCMLQWRHSGLINFVNKIKHEGEMVHQIRLEGLLIG